MASLSLSSNYYSIISEDVKCLDIEMKDCIYCDNKCEIFNVIYLGIENKYILKVKPNVTIYGNTVEREVEIIREMTKLDVSLPIEQFWLLITKTDTLGLILMEKWVTLKDYLKTTNIIETSVLQSIKKKLNVMHKSGYIHGDTKQENIVVKVGKNNSIIDVKWIDFEFSFNYIKGPIKWPLRNHLKELDENCVSECKTGRDVINMFMHYDLSRWWGKIIY